MRITDFDIYRDLLKEKSGLILSQDKSYLLDSRLGPIAKKWGYPSLEAMTLAIQGVPDNQLVIDIVEAMTTNETSFFRDARPFEIFSSVVLPSLKKTRASQRRVKVWCAACSTGQEPYSLAITLKEKDSELAGWKFDILATDLSQDVLEQARQGVYSQFEVQRGLPIQLLLKYFKQMDQKWQISDAIRKQVRYEYFNLLDSMASIGNCDVIFCRNVLIYFDLETKKKVLEKMAAQLAKDGFLFLGGAETVLGITEAFVPLPGSRGLYVHKDSPHLAAPLASKPVSA